MPGISLRTLLITTSVVLVVGTGAAVILLSFGSAQRAVDDLVARAMETTQGQVIHELDDVLHAAPAANRRLRAALSAGAISLDDPDGLLRYLVAQHLQAPDLTALHVGTPEGLFLVSYRISQRAIRDGSALIGTAGFPYNASRSDTTDPNRLHVYAVEADGRLGERIITMENMDVRQRPWYRQAAGRGRPGWTEPFVIGGSQILTLNAFEPVLGADGDFRAVFAVNLSLDRLNVTLHRIGDGIAGEVFIVNREGLLVADSVGDLSYESRYDSPTDPVQRRVEFRRLAARDSPHALIRDAAGLLREELGDITGVAEAYQTRGQLDGADYLIKLTPYDGVESLDWLVVSLVPLERFMGEIHAGMWGTLALCALVLLGGVGLAGLLAGWIARPVTALTRAAGAASAELAAVPRSGIREMDALREVLQRNAERLEQSFRDLRQREQTLSTFLEGVPVGISVHDRQKRVVFINRTGRQILGEPDGDSSPCIQRFLVAGTDEPYPTEQWPVVRGLRGERVDLDALDAEIDGRRIPLDVSIIPVLDEHGQVDLVIAAFQNIAERRRAEQLRTRYQRDLERQVTERTAALAETEARFREIAATVQQLFFVRAGPGREFLYVSPAYEKIFARPVDGLYRQPDAWLQAVHPDDLPVVQDSLAAQFRGESTVREYRIRRGDGELHWIRTQVAPIRDGQGEVSRIIGIAEDISERKRIELDLQQLNQRLQHLATVDSLTGLVNRRRLLEVLQQEWQRLLREEGWLALVLLDVDFFKPYNDHYGHLQGDECLRRVAGTLRDCLHRPADLAGRYGGEEFLIILPNTDGEGARHLAECIREALAAQRIPHDASRISQWLTVSMGLAAVRVSASLETEDLIRRADAALYRAKERRDCVHLDGAD